MVIEVVKLVLAINFGIILGCVLAIVVDLVFDFGLIRNRELVRELVRDLSRIFSLSLILILILLLLRNFSLILGLIFGLSLIFTIVLVYRYRRQTNDQEKRIADRSKSISWMYFVLNEERRRHLIDFRNQWWHETRSFCSLKRRWIIWWKTRSFEVQTLWAMGVIKLRELLQLDRLDRLP